MVYLKLYSSILQTGTYTPINDVYFKHAWTLLQVSYGVELF